MSWRFRKRILAIGVGLAMAMFLAEVGTRVAVWAVDTRRDADWAAVAERRIQSEPELNTLGHIILPSEHRDVIYRLIPDLDVKFMGARLITNSVGFRGPETTLEKQDGTFRILCLGDSVMFGSGVANGEEFVRIAEVLLNAAGSSRRVEVINTGVPGYNTGMEVALLEQVGLSYDPDMVWIDFVGNDASLPNMIVGETRDPLALDRSYLWEWLRSKLGWSHRSDPYKALVDAPFRDGDFERDLDRVRPEYRHLVGVDGYRDAMHRLADLTTERGIPVLVTSHRGVQPYVREVCEELGFPLVRGYPVVQEWMETNDVETYLGSVLTVSDEDPHPSALQHRLLGELYAERILELGLVR